ALDAGPTDRLAEGAAHQEDLTERFKSSNAVLQNSLSYVGLLSTSPAFASENAQFGPALGALAAAILQLTRDTSSEATQALQWRIDRFAAQAPDTGPNDEQAQALLAHARLLRDLLPAVDGTLRALLSASSRQTLDEARTQFARHRARMEATAQRFRLALYGVSLVLIIVLVRLGLRLRARALVRRRRAALEHVLAENSTRLINCPPVEISGRLEQALGEICRAINVERAYVVLAEKPMRVHAWYSPAAPFPPGWPDEALALAREPQAEGPGMAGVPDVAALPPGRLKAGLEAAGLRAWAAVPLVRPGRVQGILGFDAFRPASRITFPIPVVRLAADAVANALEREHLERDRERLAVRLERARRMQTIGTLASGIAHNFNNILGAILGYSEMAEPQLVFGSKPAQYVDEIRRAAERGRDLIDDILRFGRQRERRTQLVEIGAIFEETASLLRASIPSGIELSIGEVPAELAVSGEPAQLQQIVLNLCTNAAQAMQGQGSIRITAELKETAVPVSLSHGELGPGRYVCLAVTDTGRGFDEAVARRLFEPFFTTRAAGTGLGLATVQDIVRDHDGALNVESEVGKGSRFEAWLPVAGADQTAKPAKLARGRGEAVLIVESDEKRLRRDEEMVAALGYEPVGFDRPVDALAACRSGPVRFDIFVISDASRAGLDLARKLHEIRPHQPVLLAASTVLDVSADELAAAGISEVLQRPLVSAELAAALARSLRSAHLLRT
ncbi:MAG: two-component system VirA-like sensor kinase, partial [Methylobacteriaceae bacterium]|nr:two-component system VirA-like sensor kinase [Methylobacteriaceae bacterium]